MEKRIATFEATANIAVIKYWGKRNEELILPQNTSLSFTMDQLRTRTTVFFSPNFSENRFWLNNKEVEFEGSKHLLPIQQICQEAGIKEKVHIASFNCFPTGAGFASSASGVAALVCACAKAAQMDKNPTELSIIARRGSGSATRSLFGGFVAWEAGEQEDGSDSYAVPILDAGHWPELRNVIAITDAEEKAISSRKAMARTVANSSLFAKRIADLPGKITAMKEAVAAKDFAKFAELTMAESNNMHAAMLDSYPPVVYLNQTAIKIIHAIHGLNEQAGEIIAGYTFDAGPNAHVFTLADNVERVQNALKPLVNDIMICGVGSGPREITDSAEALLDESGNLRVAKFQNNEFSLETA